MASYRFSASIIKRAAGRSATAAAAYRAGECIRDERYGETFDYTRKRGIVHAEVMVPENTPAWMADRARLWNAVEAAEKRKDAQLAREIQLSLPHELTDAQRLELVRSFAREQFVAHGMIADVAIHEPHRQGDERNHHAHIMLTMRALTGDGFGRKERAWNDPANLERWREEWAQAQNLAFERYGIEARVDHRSFEAQGIDREPEQHRGPAATAMMRRGEDSRIEAENEARRVANDNRARVHHDVLKLQREIERERERFAAWKAEKTAELESAQALTKLDLVRKHEDERDALNERLRSYYGPHLATVKAEAAAVQGRLEAKGIKGFFRTLTGRTKADRARLEDLKATIADAQQRIDEARGKLAREQEADRLRLEALQERRRLEQKQGIERAEARKEKAFRAKGRELEERLGRDERGADAQQDQTPPGRSLER